MNNNLSDLYNSGLISGEAFLYCVDRNFYSLQDVVNSGIISDVLFPYKNEFASLLSTDNDSSTNESIVETTIDSSIIEDVYNEELSNIDVRTANALRYLRKEYHNFDYFINALLDEESDFWIKLQKLRNVGALSIIRAHHFAKNLSILLKEKKLNQATAQINCEQKCEDDEQQTDFEGFSSVFNAKIENLSVRSKNAIRCWFDNCNRSIATFYKEISKSNYSSTILNLPNAGKKTLQEIVPWIEELKNLLDIYSSKSIDVQTSNYFEVHQLSAIGFRGDLSPIVTLKKDLEFFPYFRAFKEYLSSLPEREQYIVSHLIVIFDKQEVLNRNEVATSLGLSIERVRQLCERIKANALQYSLFLRSKTAELPLADYYSHLNISDINRMEGTCFNENFLCWFLSKLSPLEYSLFGDVDVAFETPYDHKNKLVAVPYRLAQIFDFSRFIHYFSDIFFSKRYDIFTIDLRDCICGYFIERVYFEHIEEIEAQCKFIIESVFAFEVFNSIVTISPNAVKNNPELIEAIIRENGHPMTAMEIYTIFDKRYPNKTKSAKALIGAIHMCPNIVPMGRSGSYALAEWKEDKHRGGTIREFASEYLISLPYPIAPLEEIGEYVRQFRPTSSDKSIHANLLLEGAFALYYKGDKRYIGLDIDDYPNEYVKFEPNKDSKRDFETSCTLLEEFVVNNNRLPFSTSDDEEEMRLCRFWGVQRNKFEKNQLNDEERQIIGSMISRFQRYKVNKKDYDWMQTFDQVKSFIMNGNDLTSLPNHYAFWLKKQIEALKYNRISDSRRELITQLCIIISNAN